MRFRIGALLLIVALCPACGESVPGFGLPPPPPFTGPPEMVFRSGGSSFENLTAVEGYLFFTYDDGTHGEELWISDGTAAGTVMVLDICPGPNRSYACNLTAVGNLLLFMATDGVHGMELWRSNGTAAGTKMVKDVFSGAGDGVVPIIGDGGRAVMNSELYYRGTDGGSRQGLWKSNGTAAGTVFVSRVDPGAGSVGFPYMRAVGDMLFFLGSDPAHGEELWKTDGTPLGTQLVKEIGPGALGCLPGNLTAGESGVYFTASDTVTGVRLWKSDGTEAGTTMVAPTGPANPQFLTRAGSLLYFYASGPTTSMWQTDGTALGTVEVQPSPAETFSGFAPQGGYWAAQGGTLYFKAVDSIDGTEVWKTDGTLAGTVRVKDINPGNADATPGLFTAGPTKMVFAAQDGVHGFEVWKTDGTDVGTVQIVDVLTGSGGSQPDHLTPVGSVLYWVANDGLGLALWHAVP